MAPQPFLITKQASIMDAKLAYFEGDFERCLAVCANIRVSTLATASEVALMRARAYLRTGRPRDAQNVITESRETHTTLDASLTAQMLVASALIRQDQPVIGIAMLEEAAGHSTGAHFAIRSEIAYATALGYWAKREIDTARSYLELVDPRSDIIHARALELQAWCYSAQRDYRRSAEYFRLALLRLDECAASDRAINAKAIRSLAHLAAELFDPDIARFVDERVRHMEWTSGITDEHYHTLEHQALFHEFAGNTVQAYQYATQARESAPTLPSQIFGWVLSSAIAHNAGEPYSALVFAQRARELLETLDAGELVGEERFSMLGFAENCAHFDPEKAAELFATYRALAPIDATLVALGDPRLAAYETFVAGVIALAQGERDRAGDCYRRAFEQFRELGYVRRAVIAAHAVLQLRADADTDHELLRYVWAHVGTTSNYITKSLNRSAEHRLSSIEAHPLLASLPRAQREVVSLICMGKTNKEIAQLRSVGEQTVKNMLTKNVFPAFRVSSRAALVSACLRGRVAGIDS
jgi:DNA-binding CsgD family transcriptional regulator